MNNRVRRAAAFAAWTLIAYVVFVTLGPQKMRPHLGDAQLERFGSYFITAAMFVVGYPKRPLAICAAAMAVAILLEVGQLLVPGRDAGVPDAMAKAVGGLVGAAVAAGANQCWQKRDCA